MIIISKLFIYLYYNLSQKHEVDAAIP